MVVIRPTAARRGRLLSGMDPTMLMLLHAWLPLVLLVAATSMLCGGKKKAPPAAQPQGVDPLQTTNDGGSKEQKSGDPKPGEMAGTHDPKYQTLAGVGGECFGADKKKDGAAPAAGGAAPAAAAADGPKAPAAGGQMAGTHDPNYQTLAGVGGECFGADKKGGAAPAAGGAAAPKAPAAGGQMAGTHDPNYQTLAGVGGECFGDDKKK